MDIHRNNLKKQLHSRINPSGKINPVPGGRSPRAPSFFCRIEMFSIKDTSTRNNTENHGGEELKITRMHLGLST